MSRPSTTAHVSADTSLAGGADVDRHAAAKVRASRLSTRRGCRCIGELYSECLPSARAGWSWHEEEPRQMKKDRCGEAQRVDPVQDAAVPFDERAVILDAAVALNRR